MQSGSTRSVQHVPGRNWSFRLINPFQTLFSYFRRKFQKRTTTEALSPAQEKRPGPLFRRNLMHHLPWNVEKRRLRELEKFKVFVVEYDFNRTDIPPERFLKLLCQSQYRWAVNCLQQRFNKQPDINEYKITKEDLKNYKRLYAVVRAQGMGGEFKEFLDGYTPKTKIPAEDDQPTSQQVRQQLKDSLKTESCPDLSKFAGPMTSTNIFLDHAEDDDTSSLEEFEDREREFKDSSSSSKQLRKCFKPGKYPSILLDRNDLYPTIDEEDEVDTSLPATPASTSSIFMVNSLDKVSSSKASDSTPTDVFFDPSSEDEDVSIAPITPAAKPSLSGILGNSTKIIPPNSFLNAFLPSQAISNVSVSGRILSEENRLSTTGRPVLSNKSMKPHHVDFMVGGRQK